MQIEIRRSWPDLRKLRLVQVNWDDSEIVLGEGIPSYPAAFKQGRQEAASRRVPLINKVHDLIRHCGRVQRK